jgi:hypothetical protein
VDEGFTVKLPPVIVKPLAPAAVGVITTEAPEQIVALFTVMFGRVFTETLETAVLEATQPLVPVPVTEYEVFEDGLTVKLPPVMLKAMIPAAVGVITTGLPVQIVALLTVIVGVVLTDTVETAVLDDTQPLVPVPVTE